VFVCVVSMGGQSIVVYYVLYTFPIPPVVSHIYSFFKYICILEMYFSHLYDCIPYYLYVCNISKHAD